ncbi:MAG: phytanoyl-CoA dioxygenase family protein [Acidimicrobiia bacterium]|nr:phytanoyl-CoA dioxygenase family protein [Acidimicrobiia bacterium]
MGAGTRIGAADAWLVPAAIPEAVIEHARAVTAVAFDRLAATARRVGPWRVAEEEPGSRFVPTACSFDSRWLAATLSHGSLLVDGGLVASIEALLGGPPALIEDEAWIRRQVPTNEAVTPHVPHSWHQDGALGVDFESPAGDPVASMLPMVTAWCALDECGAIAPGLEISHDRLDGLLRPDELAPFAPRAGESTVPMIDRGDVLLLTGAVLHRTGRPAGAVAARRSIELRFVSAETPPARLRDRPLSRLQRPPRSATGRSRWDRFACWCAPTC